MSELIELTISISESYFTDALRFFSCSGTVATSITNDSRIKSLFPIVLSCLFEIAYKEPAYEF